MTILLVVIGCGLVGKKISSEKFLWRALLILTSKDDFKNVKQRTAESIK